MRQRRLVQRAGRRVLWKRRRHRPGGDIDFLLGKIGEGRSRLAEIPGKHFGRRVAEPVGDREGAELGEIAVVEHEEEGAGAGADALDRMAMAAREVPDVARAEIDDLALAVRIDGGDAAIALDHIGPFGGIGVPVQLAQSAGLERHVDPGELLGDREAGDVRLLGGAAVELLGLLRAKRIAERGKLGAVERRGRGPVRRLPRLTAERGGIPQKTAHRHTSSQHAAPGYLDHDKIPRQGLASTRGVHCA